MIPNHVPTCACTYIDRHVVPGKFPGVEVKPVVRNLHLVAVDDLLLENTVAVS